MARAMDAGDILVSALTQTRNNPPIAGAIMSAQGYGTQAIKNSKREYLHSNTLSRLASANGILYFEYDETLKAEPLVTVLHDIHESVVMVNTKTVHKWHDTEYNEPEFGSIVFAVPDQQDSAVKHSVARLETVSILHNILLDNFIWPAALHDTGCAPLMELDNFMLPIIPSLGIFAPVSVTETSDQIYSYNYISPDGDEFYLGMFPLGMVTFNALRSAWLDMFSSEGKILDSGAFRHHGNISPMVEQALRQLDLDPALMNVSVHPSALVDPEGPSRVTERLTGRSALFLAHTPGPWDRVDLGWNGT
ncbi:hypothetical protein SEA_JUMBO_70 [Gordonia phage Jumbo]|uniref:Uncharacterized protein n=1 Tax=Gordonia phage Jumbo TaxID=1887650 RepID=A0A1B3B0W3_9CAUD|nr:hypothetical protein BIZ69_gp070 [Gordonia phage Jumbo]AOE44578.1 hypothetical protein SEA_JUMBO_70 [Gordonia phage Jumbo]